MTAQAGPSPDALSPDALSQTWADARLAAALFALDPVGLGGVVLRGGPGPVRDRWLAQLKRLLPAAAPVRRIPLNIADDRLLGGVDLAASLAAGRPIGQRGVLAECDGGIALLPMAERITAATAARLVSVLDAGETVVERDGLGARHAARLGLVALDEGIEAEERPPRALADRLAFLIDLGAVDWREAQGDSADLVPTPDAPARIAAVAAPIEALTSAICEAALACGLASVRAPLLALRAARAHAALAGRTEIAPEDAAVAVRLVLAPRALTAPVQQPDDAEAPSDGETAAEDQTAAPPPPADQGADERADDVQPPSDDELMIAAIQAALPADLLDRIDLGDSRRKAADRGCGGGGRSPSARRGRPIGSRPGALRPGDRLDLVGTLRAAAPWRVLRGAAAEARIPIRPQDFRIRRFVQRTESTTIFVVDASGSTAFQRLAEAKGAVELLLAKAYVARAQVALIAFRHLGAELLLPPTRSLTRARRRLAELPGGGGTPLSAGLDAALVLARSEAAHDRTPLLVVLTDGRANIGAGGKPGRAGAEADAQDAARRIGAAGVAGVYIDTSPRTPADGDRFARLMGAVYAPLPYVEASAVSTLVERVGAARR
jgi:magnesium chelatase subunit D